MNGKNCGNCRHFDEIHQFCPMFTLDESVGRYYLKRLAESPACTSEFLQRPDPQGIPYPLDV